jgi:hypothetical protein
MKTAVEWFKEAQLETYNKGYQDALIQIKNTNLTINAESKEELQERLQEYFYKGWVAITPTYFHEEGRILIHSQVIFKPSLTPNL